MHCVIIEIVFFCSTECVCLCTCIIYLFLFYLDPATFLRIGLTTHNKLRKIHDSPPMRIDPILTMQAYQYAQTLTNLGYLKHEAKEKLMGMGENLAIGCYDGDYDMSAEEAVIRWLVSA